MTKRQRRTERPRHTRRDFAKSVAALAATPLAGPLTEAEAQPSKPAAPQGPPAVALALTEVVRLRYGKHLSDEQLEEIKRALERGQHAAERLRRFPLQNGDEPALTFHAERP